MDILVVQHVEADPVGILGRYLEVRGAWLHTWLVPQRSTPPHGHYDGLIVLGGSMNACEDDNFPHLIRVAELIRKFHSQGKPVLGICLGAQLIARAFGSRVYQNEVPELGFTPLFPTAAPEEPWLQDYPPGMPMMQWHFDTFELPVGAKLLLTNNACKNQAFRIGSNIYGLQFHPEVTPQTVMNWMAFKTEWIEANYPHLFEQLREQLVLHWVQSAQFTEKLANAWYDQVVTSAQTGSLLEQGSPS
ncbi:type 1 glutamine amidotransferase [Phormidium tenue]|uniref:GMP synthase n=1 Tax=Phormidium tenue NIES-30 TaxID=549789 RepID=A0A1U7J0Q2_9CYAN|nr:type 1 glutamine amidotransferase [Phormidium tenue]MBD2234254.1 type 1 glutamine amidotransferase [Phormidium tenue FACHB-1052]OKH45188.1 GMP synthase [Phormidium tenue NIES-30]